MKKMTEELWVSEVYAGKYDQSSLNLLDYEDKIAIYGAGYAGLVLAEQLISHGIAPLCFIDQSVEKQGNQYFGTPVKSLNDAVVEDITVIVSILDKKNMFEEIVHTLKKSGCSHILHILDLRNEVDLFRNVPLMIAPDLDLLWQRRSALYRTYIRLTDEESRHVFCAVIHSLWSGSDFTAPTHHIKEQYFDEAIISPIQDEVFVDCGAHIGEVFSKFIHKTTNWKHYWAFEADTLNIKKLQQTILSYISDGEMMEKISIYNIPLSDGKEPVRIRNYAMANSVVFPSEHYECSIMTTSLDDYFPTENITYLKVDVEGWEMRVLRGARQTIQRDRPVIAISVYHKIDDLWEIADLLSTYVMEYQFYMRSYMNINETILYAVPPERVIEST